MSDGNLTIPGQCRSPRYQQTCKEPTFLEWVASWLPTESRISGPHPSGKYQYWLLSTRTSPLYTPVYERWYPYGKKRLPADLNISPHLLLTEYLGDGFLLADEEKKLQHIEFGTYGFKKDDLVGLVAKLQRQGLEFRLTAKNALYLRGGRVKSFLDYIGPCPVVALGYKWRWFVVEDRQWRRIISVESQETHNRPGNAVKIMLECGHWFRKPASRLRSGSTNMTICHTCRDALLSY